MSFFVFLFHVVFFEKQEDILTVVRKNNRPIAQLPNTIVGKINAVNVVRLFDAELWFKNATSHAAYGFFDVVCL
ncbi:hypothetical protein FACS189449_08050 [Alphaproteobacteria bacterium]|nr:hypothetical protein FACS189449_08050 [Alphaproteobacteria bacterium]